MEGAGTRKERGAKTEERKGNKKAGITIKRQLQT